MAMGSAATTARPRFSVIRTTLPENVAEVDATIDPSAPGRSAADVLEVLDVVVELVAADHHLPALEHRGKRPVGDPPADGPRGSAQRAGGSGDRQQPRDGRELVHGDTQSYVRFRPFLTA